MDKTALFNATVQSEDFEIEGVGTIKLKGLTRWEMLQLFKLEGNQAKQDQAALHFGMVDPEMSEADVAEWSKVAPGGLINEIAMVINRLSGIGKGADKSKVPSDGGGPVD